jgi:hypothetical protein
VKNKNKNKTQLPVATPLPFSAQKKEMNALIIKNINSIENNTTH